MKTVNDNRHLTKALLLAVVMTASQTMSSSWIAMDGGGKKSEKDVAISIESRDQSGNVMKEYRIDAIRELDVSISVPGIAVVDEEKKGRKYQRITIPGITALSNDVGKPAVPVYILMQEVPFGSIPRVIAEPVLEKTLDHITVMPAQEPLPESSTGSQKFVIDELTYAASQFYPVSSLISYETVVIRNHQFVRAEIALCKARPGTGELLVAQSMTVTVKLDMSMAEKKMKVMPSSSPSMDMLFTSSANKTLENSPLSLAPERYMILMDDQFAGNAALNAFIDWKRAKGYNVVVVRTGDIDAEGAPDSSQIRDYLVGLSAAEYPSYLLIIGDETADNGVDGWYFITSRGGYTDLYYAERDPIGSGVPVPDLFYGRLPAKNSAELTSMLNKVLSMDRTPPTSSMFDRVLVAATIQDYDDYNNQADRWFCETGDAFACYFEQNGYTTTRSFTNSDSVDVNCKWNALPILWDPSESIGPRVFNTFISGTDATTRISTTINNGVAIALHRNHGDVDRWSDPSFTTTDISALTNGNNRPFIYSIECLCGSYHRSNNFTRELLLHSNGGSYGVIAAVDVSFSIDNDWMSHGFGMGLMPDYRSWHNNATVPVNGVDWTYDMPAPTDVNMHGMTEGNARKGGQSLNYGKIYLLQRSTGVTTAFRLFHLFGDPEGDIMVHTPQTQTVTHPAQINTGSQTVTVTTTGTGIRMVCLYSAALGIHQVVTGSGGVATFNINPSLAGTVRVTVTGFGRRPYEGTIVVNANNQANDVFGFENTSLWSFTIGSGTLSLNTTLKTQGNASMNFGGNNFREITCVPLSTTAIINETSHLALDLYIGSLQPNPWWIGQAQLLVSCASAGINHLYIGAVELTGKPFNVFSTMQFTLPANVLNVLRGNYNDFRFHVVLNTNPNSGPYLVDNMRFVP